MKKPLIDYMSQEDYNRYNELISMAEQAKADYKETHKAEKKPRGPMTIEQKKKLAEGRLAKAQAALDALLAAQD